jgi:hypothetical protein
MIVAPLFGATIASRSATSTDHSFIDPWLPPFLACVSQEKVDNTACNGSNFFFNAARIGLLLNLFYLLENALVVMHPFDCGCIAVFSLRLCRVRPLLISKALIVYSLIAGLLVFCAAVYSLFFVWSLGGFAAVTLAILLLLGAWDLCRTVRGEEFSDHPLFEERTFNAPPPILGCSVASRRRRERLHQQSVQEAGGRVVVPNAEIVDVELADTAFRGVDGVAEVPVATVRFDCDDTTSAALPIATIIVDVEDDAGGSRRRSTNTNRGVMESPQATPIPIARAVTISTTRGGN